MLNQRIYFLIQLEITNALKILAEITFLLHS